MSLKKLECQEKIYIINYQNKKKNKTKIVNVDNNEENVYEKIILQDVEYDDNID